MALKDIVNINITRQTTSVAVAAFNVPLILSTFATSKTTTAFTRARSYGSVKEMTDDGWASTDAVYKIANAIFSQNPSVSRVVVGRADNGDADIAASMAAIQNEDNSWYGVAVDQAMASNFAAIAAWVESTKRFSVLWTTDPNTYDATKSTDLASTLKALSYDRTAVIWHAQPSDGADYPDAAWMGEGFPYDPGTSTWAYKTLKGVKPDNISGKETTLQNKNCNYYSEVGGVNITQEGKVASGEWIDIIIGTDWLEARLREEVFSALVNNRKIPYDDTGIAMIEGLVKGVLQRAAKAGILQEDSIVVTVPKYADIPQADKIARKLPDVKFTALYQGAIHRVTINGTISV
jgi:hypothetical protein